MSDEQDLQARVYKAFHAWLAVNKRRIKAPHSMTVIYSGWDRKSIPVWHRLNSRGKDVKEKFGVVPRWAPIQVILEDLPFTIDQYLDGGTDPFKGFSYGTTWDFATKARKHKLLSQRDSQQVWLNLSIWYNKNASGKIWVWEGDVLKEFPDLLLAEIPVLMKNKKIDAKSMEKAIELAPKSAEAWKRCRLSSPGQRLDGR